MDAQDAFDILDALAKEPTAELTPSQEAALRFAEESPEIEREYRLQTPFDRQISELMSDVEIPVGLQDRLLESVQREAEHSDTVSAKSPTDLTPPRGVSRRTIFAVLSGLALTACVAFLFLQEPALTAGQIDRVMSELWHADVPPFDSNFEAELPIGAWRSNHVRFEQDWNGVAVGDHTDHDLAIKRFVFLSNRRTTHEGLLAVIPAKQLESKPSNRDPFTGEVRYLTASDGSQYAIVSWSEEELGLVFFLAVPAEDHSLRSLQDALSTPVA